LQRVHARDSDEITDSFGDRKGWDEIRSCHRPH
jgi:hypothetical protein